MFLFLTMKNIYLQVHVTILLKIKFVLQEMFFQTKNMVLLTQELSDMEQGVDYHTTLIWQDECRASINAAKTAHNLTDRDKSNLVMDAIYRAKEFEHLIEMDDFMKEVIYGYSNREKNISYSITPINYVSETSEVGTTEKRICDSSMSKMSRSSRDYDDFER